MAEGKPVVGKIVWHDLITNDVDKAMTFYSELIGWTFGEFAAGPMTIKIIQAGEKGIGSLMEPEVEGVPPHWLAYATVADTDQTAERVVQLGGQVVVGPLDIPQVGRFAGQLDPQGAAMAFITQLAEEPADQPQPAFKEFCWDECMAADPEALMGYYGELFGWSFKALDMGPMGTYHLAMRGEHQAAGIMKLPADVKAPPHWVSYIYVEDLDGTTAKAKTLGATVLVPVTDIPTIGRFSMIADPVGAVVALFGDAAS